MLVERTGDFREDVAHVLDECILELVHGLRSVGFKRLPGLIDEAGDGFHELLIP